MISLGFRFILKFNFGIQCEVGKNKSKSSLISECNTINL